MVWLVVEPVDGGAGEGEEVGGGEQLGHRVLGLELARTVIAKSRQTLKWTVQDNAIKV